MPIQDNLNGALLISAIDFTLSFFIIGGIGVILALFPLINRFGRQNDEHCQSKVVEHPVQSKSAPATATLSMAPATASIHPGLTDQQLLVLLTAAASQVLDRPVRVHKFRPLTGSWAAQGRSDLQSHRLK